VNHNSLSLRDFVNGSGVQFYRITGVTSVEFCGVWDGIWDGVWDIEGLMIAAGDSIGVVTG